VNSPAQLWIEVQDEVCTNDWQQPGTNCNGSWSASETIPLHYTFDTPVGAAASSLCGKVLFEDYHVEDAVTGGTVFPAECPGGTMTPQEKLLEFELFDLASCITPVQTVTPTCIPRTCADQGIQCGPAGDGCGGVASDTDGGTTCGTCSSPETCGGGVPGVCGKPSCTMISCSSQGVQCGPAGDGCGGLLNCGACPSGQTCGGGGTPGKCGAPDGGGTTTCPAETCASQGLHCGPAGDGCGNLIQCGTCTPPQTCGGGGTPGVCGGSGCVSTSCSALGYNCGPTGDGCGNVLQCGTCPANQSCGGGGTPGVCGSACTPGSCASLEINCGPAGNGCGGLLQCGTCTLPETCGGGGVAGQCGASTIK
jgi:hypothetical protein